MITPTRIESIYLRAMRAGVTINKLCRENGVDPGTVARWKRGKMQPRESNLLTLEGALDRMEGVA